MKLKVRGKIFYQLVCRLLKCSAHEHTNTGAVSLAVVNGAFQTQYVRVIPQRAVDNNLGPDRLAGLKALDHNYCRQPTL